MTHSARARGVQRALLALALAVGVPLSAYADGSTPRPAAHARYTGEQLFRGIMLGNGPVSMVIPEVRDFIRPQNFVSNPVVLRTMDDMSDRVVAAVRQYDPSFLDAFGRDMQSGDRIRIQRSLEQARLVTRKAVQALPEMQRIEAASHDPKALEQLRAEMLKSLPATDSSPAARTARVDALLAGMQSEFARSGSNNVCAVVELYYVATIAATVAGVVNYLVAFQVFIYKEATVSEQLATADNLVVRDQLIDSVARLLRA